MKTICLGIFLVVALIQLSIPASVIWKHKQTLSHGRVWKFKTAPVDPVDAMRGRYLRLRFAAEEFTQPERLQSAAWVYAVLKEDAEGFAKIDHISATPVTGDDVLRVEPSGWWDGRQHILFPFNQYWVTEKNAVAAEKAYAENSRREKQNAYVTVRVRDGEAALEQLYIDNQPLADYLRAHPAR